MDVARSAKGPEVLNIVVPMAGAGSRFARAGFTDPKPLIPVGDQTMIQLVISNLTPSRPHRFVFIVQRQHDIDYGLTSRLSEWAPGCEIVRLDGVTDGAARSVLAAEDLIDNDYPLMIANSDQFVNIDIDDYLAELDADLNADGLIMTMEDRDPKWSYVGFDGEGKVVRVVEKEVISDHATVGIYNFRRGSDFVTAAKEMIAAEEKSNNEYYVAPTYNQLLRDGHSIIVCNVGAVGEGMRGLGTPDDLAAFLADPIAMSHATDTR